MFILNHWPWRQLPFWRKLVTIFLSLYHYEITIDNFHAKGQGQRSKQNLPKFGSFRTWTPVWIHRWLWNGAQGLKWCRRGALVFQGHPSNFKVTWAETSMILNRIQHFQIVSLILINGWLPNIAQSLKCHRRGALEFLRSSVKFQGHKGRKIDDFDSNWVFGTVPPVWIRRWLQNDAQSLRWHRRGAILFFKVIHQIFISQGPKNRQFGSHLSVSGWQLQF